MEIKNPLAQNLKELSDITQNHYIEQTWSGAVNMVFVEDKILLIKRTDDMPSHKGQVGFLGGHKHAGETDPIVTAFRELHEESGIDSENFEFLGLLEPVTTNNKRLIIPVVSRYRHDKESLVDQMVSNGEWSHFILVESSFLADPANWQTARMWRHQQYTVFFVPLMKTQSLYHPDILEEHEYMLWGATAKMIWNFFKNNPQDVK